VSPDTDTTDHQGPTDEAADEERETGRRDRSRRRRLPFGPGNLLPSARLGGLDTSVRFDEADALDVEMNILVHALAEHGPTDREELTRMVGGRYWGPGRFGAALQTAVAEGAIRRLSRRTYGPVDAVP
jgi:hypothetical protein